MSDDIPGASQPDPTAPANPPAGDPAVTPIEPAAPPVDPIVPSNDFTLPEEHASKPWASKVTSQDDLYKQIDNLTSAVGKKTIGAPEDWTNEEQRNELFSKLVPEKGYEVEGIQEGDTEAYHGMFKGVGLSNWQAQEITSKFNDMLNSKHAEMYGQEAIDKVVSPERRDALAPILRKNMSTESQDKLSKLENLSPEGLALFYEYAENVKKNYGIQEGGGLNAPAGGQESKASLDKQLTEIDQKIIDLGKRPHGQADKDNLMAQKQTLLKQLFGGK